MITKRIIPCLDVKDGRVVKGVNFKDLSDVSSPVELGRYYSDAGADELVFYDITASSDGRRIFTDILKEVASQIFIPLTVGGGIQTLEDFDRVLSLNLTTSKVENPAEDTEVDAELEAYILEKIEERKAAKKEKDFAKADAIRDDLLAKGIVLKDTREGVIWHKA